MHINLDFSNLHQGIVFPFGMERGRETHQQERREEGSSGKGWEGVFCNTAADGTLFLNYFLPLRNSGENRTWDAEKKY
jgi:hypothetical protein